MAFPPAADPGPSTRRPSGPNHRALPPLPPAAQPRHQPSAAAAQLNARFQQAYLGRSHHPASSSHDQLFADPIWATGDGVGSSGSSAIADGKKPLPPPPPPSRQPPPPLTPGPSAAYQQWSSSPSTSTASFRQSFDESSWSTATAAMTLASPQQSTAHEAFVSAPALPTRPSLPAPPTLLPAAAPAALDPWSQQEEHDQRRAAELACLSAHPPLSSSASASAAARAPTGSSSSSSSSTAHAAHRRTPSAFAREEADRLEAVRRSLEEAHVGSGGGGEEHGYGQPAGAAHAYGGSDAAGLGRRPMARLAVGPDGRSQRATSSTADESVPYYHTPPHDSKPTPPASSSPPAGSSSFEAEFRAHADLVSALERWQAGALPPALEWHELVPAPVRLGLDKGTVERQGLLWEIFRSEQEYVKNLEGGLNGYYTPLSVAPPDVFSPEDRETFLQDTFYNMQTIFPKHSRMVYRLQERQLETHPVVHSIADILIDSLLDLLGPYEVYLKHYPYAEARLRKELASNKAFNAYVSHLSQAPAVRKQDLASFLVSPLSRLSKLELALDRLRRITPATHDDAAQLPVVLDQIRGMLRAVQPGVDAANAKVKAWVVARKLRFRKGERNDLGLELESNERALLRMGKIWRRHRTERDWHGWSELCLILFDNYLLITKEETKPGGHAAGDDDVVYSVVSRPIPLEFLAIVGSEHDPVEHRRDMVVDYARRNPLRAGMGALLEPLVQPGRDIFAFHLEHRGLGKQYSLYVESEQGRREWLACIRDQVTIRRVHNANNALFSVSPLSYNPPKRSRQSASPRPAAVSRMTEAMPGTHGGGTISPASSGLPSGQSSPSLLQHHSTTGSLSTLGSASAGGGSGGGPASSITTAASFQRFNKEMFMVADGDGLSIGYRDDSRSHRLVIESSSITAVCVLDIDRLLVLATSTLYSLELADLLPAADPDAWARVRKDDGETVSAWGESVSGFQAGRRAGKLLVLYWCLNRLSGQTSIEVYEPLLRSNAPQRALSIGSLSSFVHKRTGSHDGSGGGKKKRPPGYRHVASGFALGAVRAVTFCDELVFIAVDKGFIVTDPLVLATSTANAPSFPETAQLKPVFATLKQRVASFQPLLVHRIDDDCFLAVYETGCFWLSRRGVVAKAGAYITWETRATAAAVRGRHLLLFAKDRRFLAVHDVWFGSLRHVADDARLRLVGDAAGRNVLAVQDDGGLVELLETVALPVRAHA